MHFRLLGPFVLLLWTMAAHLALPSVGVQAVAGTLAITAITVIDLAASDLSSAAALGRP